jgi:hypothetical protein
MERDETLVAQAFATSSIKINQFFFPIQKSGSEDAGLRAAIYSLAPLLKASSRAKKVPMAKT